MMLRRKATSSAPTCITPVLILLVSPHLVPAVAFTFTLDPSRQPTTRKSGLVKCSSFVRRSRTTRLQPATSLVGGRGDWDNDDFLSSLSSTPKGGSNENEGKGGGDDQGGSQSERFRRMKEIAESGVRPPPPPAKLSAPPPPPQAGQSEAGASAASTAVPPPPGYGPPGYYPPPGYGYPPPPGAEGQSTTAGAADDQTAAAATQLPTPPVYYPPPPPPGYDPSNPPPAGYMPGYYPPQGYYPPPQGYYAQQQTQQAYDPKNPPPPQPPQYYPPPPPQAQSQAPPARTEADPSPRRRRPEDKIANTSDLYLEQLKIDSTSRTRARLRGDEETANKAWADPQIMAVKEQLEPVLSSETRKATEQGESLYTTSEDEMLIFQGEGEEVDKSDTGISYRQRMADKMKGKKKSAAKTAEEESPKTATAPDQPVTVDAVDEAPKAAVESIADVDAIKPETAVASPPSLAEATEREDRTPTAVLGEQQQPQPQVPPPPPMSSDQEASVPLTPEPSTAEEEDARRQIRTLMGLLLKHRGGPGFGAGRLKNPAEIRRFEETLGEVMDILGKETGVDVQAAASASATGGASSDGGPALSGALACVKGAVQMYEGAAAGRERDDLLGPLRDALRQAVDACTAAIDAGDDGGRDGVDLAVPVAASSASPSAEAEKTESGSSSRGTVATTSTSETSTGKGARTSVLGGDGSSNEEVLRKAYRELKEARGDGKYGLDPSITGLEASELADSLLDMRRVLMSELDIDGGAGGSDDSSSSAEAIAAGETKSKSNYQHMLAKAKAAKAAKKAGSSDT